MLQRISIFWGTVYLTILIELVTVFCRYFLKLESTENTASTVGVLTMGIRIHHGYIGLLMIVLAYLFLRNKVPYYRWTIIIGLSLVFSDLVHHFLVLWPIEGDPHFDLVYPKE